jgi:hypothetical protein
MIDALSVPGDLSRDTSIQIVGSGTSQLLHKLCQLSNRQAHGVVGLSAIHQHEAVVAWLIITNSCARVAFIYIVGQVVLFQRIAFIIQEDRAKVPGDPGVVGQYPVFIDLARREHLHAAVSIQHAKIVAVGRGIVDDLPIDDNQGLLAIVTVIAGHSQDGVAFIGKFLNGTGSALIELVRTLSSTKAVDVLNIDVGHKVDQGPPGAFGIFKAVDCNGDLAIPILVWPVYGFIKGENIPHGPRQHA